MIYIFVIILLLVSIIRHDINGKPYNKYIANFYPILFAMLAGLSYRMGIDCIRYEMYYEEISFNSLVFDTFAKEPGYQIFTSTCKLLHLPWYIVHTIICMFVNVSIASFLKKYSCRSYFTSLFIYFFLFYYLFNFEILRQSIAMALILRYISINGVNSRKGYYFTVLFAFTFHYVAIVAVLIPLFVRIQWNAKKCILALSFVCIIGNIIALKFGDFLRILEIIYSGLGRYAIYSDNEDYTLKLNLFGQIQVLFLQILPFIIPLLFSQKRYLSNNNAITLLYAIFVMLGTYVSILNRISYVFSIPAIVLLSNYLILYRTKLYRLFRSFIIIMLLIYCYQFYCLKDKYDFAGFQKLYPYTSILDKSAVYDREVWLDNYIY